MTPIELARRLDNAGCTFVISVPWVGGSHSATITPEQAAQLLDSKIVVYAQVAGLSPDEYQEWHASGGTVLCSGTTAKKRPCNHPIKGGTGLSPEAWKRLYDHGGYCAAHGG